MMRHRWLLGLTLTFTTAAAVTRADAQASPAAQTGPTPTATGTTAETGSDWTRAEALGRLRSDDPAVRAAAVRRLTGLDDPLAVRPLAERLSVETSTEIRRLIVVALGAIGGNVARQVLRETESSDDSVEVRAAAHDALLTTGGGEPVGQSGPSAEPAHQWPQPAGPVSGPASPGPALLGQGDVRLGGQLMLTQLWRDDRITWSPGDEATNTTELLSVGLSPAFGYFVLSWLELGLELTFSYGAKSATSYEPSESTETTTIGVNVLPLVRTHIVLAEHVLFTAAALLGYGYESSKTTWPGSGVDAELSADGLVVGPEVGIELAASHLLIPIWVRFLYRPWGIDDTGTSGASHDSQDYVVAFGTGLHAYF